MPNFFERHSNTIITVTSIILAFVGLVTINDRRFDAQDRLISQRLDAQDRLISQRFDAQVKSTAERLDAQDKSTAERLDAQDKSTAQRFDALGKRMDDLRAEMNRRFDDLTDEVSTLRELISRISDRVSRNEGQIDVIREQIQAADKPSP